MKRLALLAVLAFVTVPAPAHAHPLGNFTVNQYAGIRVTPSTVDIDYVLDLAELPTVAERAPIETAGAATQCAQIAATSTLQINRRPTTLHSAPVTLTFPPGAAGLATLRLECHFSVNTHLGTAAELTFEFGTYKDRAGLREITVAGDGATITRTDAPAISRTARLTSYPTDLLAKPLDMRQAAFTVAPGGPDNTLSSATAAKSEDEANRVLAALGRVAGHTELTLGLALLGLALAVLLGAGHAIAPGHGKTIMAAYLIGQRGRRRQALAIAATVTATHTAGVLLLGLVITASFALAPQSLYRWLAFANGLLVAAIGLILLRRALRGHHHHHADHHRGEHDGDHYSAHTPAHGHHAATVTSAVTQLARVDTHQHPAPPPVHDRGPSRKTVLAMGFVGGLTPSPSAVVVLLGAAAVGRAWFGVLLVLAYGAGMAATLTGVGMALARFSDQIQALIARRWGASLLHRLPAGTGFLILLVGLAIATIALFDPVNSVQ